MAVKENSVEINLRGERATTIDQEELSMEQTKEMLH